MCVLLFRFGFTCSPLPSALNFKVTDLATATAFRLCFSSPPIKSWWLGDLLKRFGAGKEQKSCHFLRYILTTITAGAVAPPKSNIPPAKMMLGRWFIHVLLKWSHFRDIRSFSAGVEIFWILWNWSFGVSMESEGALERREMGDGSLQKGHRLIERNCCFWVWLSSRWCFQFVCYFHPYLGRFPVWLTLFRWVETAN